MFAILSGHTSLFMLQALLPAFRQAGEVYLVGGAVRDALLRRPVADFDFASSGDPTPLAQALARQGGGHWFWLDEPRRQSRVLLGEATFDFAPLRAPTLAGDLAARDFTVNAMALNLAGPLTVAGLIDPLGGRSDLDGRRLRCAGPGVLDDDPLRILKGVRHALELGLTVDAATLAAMQAAAARLVEVAPERLRLEIWRILAAPLAAEGVDLLGRCGGGVVLFGPAFRMAEVELARRLCKANELLAALAAAEPAVAGWLGEPVEQGLDRAGLLRWAGVLTAVDVSLPLALARCWRFSRAATVRIAALDMITAELWQELAALPQRPRPIALWALRYGPDPVDLLIILALRQSKAIADICAAIAPRLRQLAELPDPKQVTPLVDGHWLQAALDICGDEVGAAQARLRAAELSGAVQNADEARRYLLRSRRERG